MIRAAYVLISSIISAAIYTLLITVFRDRVIEMVYEYLPVPASSPYHVDGSIITWALYAVPIVIVITGFVYFAIASTKIESDTTMLGYYR